MKVPFHFLAPKEAKKATHTAQNTQNSHRHTSITSSNHYIHLSIMFSPLGTHYLNWCKCTKSSNNFNERFMFAHEYISMRHVIFLNHSDI